MENEIKMNILEILKKCPIGTKLYSSICGECELHNVLDNTFSVISGKTIFVFLHDGRYKAEGEVCIFPSKKNRDWNKFQMSNAYKNGDIIHIITKNKNEYITIFKNIKNDDLCSHAMLAIKTSEFYKTIYTDICHIKEHKLATKKEKERLFEQIENNGYKWNSQTKTLEKLIEDKFDISTLKPFDKVLARDSNTDVWEINFFSSKRDNYFLTMTRSYEQCIPYEPNKHLLETDEKCDEYYKTW